MSICIELMEIMNFRMINAYYFRYSNWQQQKYKFDKKKYKSKLKWINFDSYLFQRVILLNFNLN